jgi:hypothetical protein
VIYRPSNDNNKSGVLMRWYDMTTILCYNSNYQRLWHGRTTLY